jgi:hypothetical protein
MLSSKHDVIHEPGQTRIWEVRRERGSPRVRGQSGRRGIFVIRCSQQQRTSDDHDIILCAYVHSIIRPVHLRHSAIHPTRLDSILNSHTPRPRWPISARSLPIAGKVSHDRTVFRLDLSFFADASNPSSPSFVLCIHGFTMNHRCDAYVSHVRYPDAGFRRDPVGHARMEVERVETCLRIHRGGYQVVSQDWLSFSGPHII